MCATRRTVPLEERAEVEPGARKERRSWRRVLQRPESLEELAIARVLPLRDVEDVERVQADQRAAFVGAFARTAEHTAEFIEQRAHTSCPRHFESAIVAHFDQALKVVHLLNAVGEEHAAGGGMFVRERECVCVKNATPSKQQKPTADLPIEQLAFEFEQDAGVQRTCQSVAARQHSGNTHRSNSDSSSSLSPTLYFSGVSRAARAMRLYFAQPSRSARF